MRVQKNQFFFGLELTRAGESIPDVIACDRMAEAFGVALEDMLHYEEKNKDLMKIYSRME